MFKSKKCSVMSVIILSVAFSLAHRIISPTAKSQVFKGQVDASDEQYLEVSYLTDSWYDPTTHYSEYWCKKPDNIENMSIGVKLIRLNEEYLIYYEIKRTWDPQSVKLKTLSIGSFFTTGEYEVELWFFLMDENGDILESICTKSDSINRIFFRKSLDSISDGSSQIERAIVTSKKLPFQLAKRIKKVCVEPRPIWVER